MNNTIGRRAMLAGGTAILANPALRSRADTAPLRIGVMDDMNGPYSAAGGLGSAAAVRMAVREFGAAHPDIAVDVIVGDMLNKPDVGAEMARQWFDQGGVDAIIGISQSAVALAVVSITQAKDKLAIITGASFPDLTGKACTPNHFQWTYDLWALAHGTALTLTKDGFDSWFFISPDYLSGHMAEQFATEVIVANGGKVAGHAYYPFPATTDFSGFLLQAQASGAKVISVGSGTDAVNTIKQAVEFGLPQSGVRLTSGVMGIEVVDTLGLATARGIVATEPFYWDLNDRTRAFSNRFAAVWNQRKPTMIQAGTYSAAVHYLKAVASLGLPAAKASGRAVAERMKALPGDDDAFGPGTVRVDGKYLHPMYVFETKTPEQSKERWDYYRLLQTIPADQAFEPLSPACPLVHA